MISASTSRYRRPRKAISFFYSASKPQMAGSRALGLTYARRQRIGITTIGAIDVNKRQRTHLRKLRENERYRRRRQALGVSHHVPRGGKDVLAYGDQDCWGRDCVLP